jgi:hypothetical protein
MQKSRVLRRRFRNTLGQWWPSTIPGANYKRRFADLRDDKVRGSPRSQRLIRFNYETLSVAAIIRLAGIIGDSALPNPVVVGLKA